jgi:hypothetical protein
MNFEYLSDVQEATVNKDIHKLIMQLSKMYATTGSDYFKSKLQELREYVKELPDDTCIAWGVNKHEYEVEPTPIPDVELYGLLHCVTSERKDKSLHDCNEIFHPEYTVKIFKDLEQGRRAESSSAMLYKKTALQNGKQEYHPTLYKIKFEAIPELLA